MHTCKKQQHAKAADPTSRAPACGTLTPSRVRMPIAETIASLVDPWKDSQVPKAVHSDLGATELLVLLANRTQEAFPEHAYHTDPPKWQPGPHTAALRIYPLGCVENTSSVQILPHVGEHGREQNVKKCGSTAQDFLKRRISKWGSGPQRCVLGGWLTDHTHYAKLAQPAKPFNANSMEVLHSKCKYWYSSRYIAVILGKADISITQK